MNPPKYGTKSSENANKRHFWRWSGENPGEGVGTCKYCAAKHKFVAKGPRGGKVHVYAKKGSTTFTETEPQCVTRTAEQVTAAKQPKKKAGKKSGTTAKKKNGKKVAKAGAKKGGTRSKSAAKKQSKKSAATSAPATETQASSTA